MAKTAAETDLVEAAPFAVRTDARAMTVHLERVAGVPVDSLEASAVIEEMKRRDLAVTPQVAAAAAAVVEAWRTDRQAPPSVVVSEGRPAEHGRSGRIVLSPEYDIEQNTPAEDDNSFSHYATHLVTVKAGAVIATIAPPLAGTPGMDVYGGAIKPRDGRPAKFQLKGGCHADEQAATIIADLDGTLTVEGEQISVSEGLHIRGNVDFNTGHVDSPGAIVIDGHVADLFNVTSGSSVTIAGDVHVAEIRADGDIAIGATVAAREKGICIAGGDIAMRAVETSTVVARGSIHVAREAMSAHLFAGVEIDSPRAAIAGGVAAARGAVTVKTLGSAGQAPTLVLAGVDWMIRALTEPMETEVEKLNESLEKRLPALNTLKASLKRLTHAQREQVVELEYDYHTLLDQRDERVETIKMLQANSNEVCQPIIKVFDAIHPGVEVRLGNRVARIEKPIPGPVTVQLAEAGPIKQIVTQTSGGAVVGLKTGKVDPLFRVELPEFPPSPVDMN